MNDYNFCSHCRLFRQAVRSSDKVDDSLLSCFDPLLVQSDGPSELQTHGGSVEHETSLIGSSNQCLIPNLTNNEVIPLSEHRGLQNPEDRLISPLIYDQNMQPITDTTPSTPLSTGFTPVPSAIKQLNVSVTTGSASPFVFSPWMHRSILDQAFGDGDHSPEWTEPADPDTTPPTSAPPLSVGCQLSVDPVQTKPVLPKPVQLSCLSDATEQSDLSQSYTSAVALSDAGDLDMLASLLERVNVCQDDGDSETSESAERPESEVDVLQRTPAIRIPLLRAPGTYDVNSKPHPRAVNLPTGFTPPRYVDTIETTPTVHSLHQARRRTINLSSTPNVAPVVDCANSPLMTVSEPHKSDSDCRNSGRISLGSISGMVTMAARSLYDRIGGGSSVVTRSPATTIPITNAASPVNYDSQTDIIQHAQQSPPLKQVVSPPGCRSSYLNATVNITDPSVHSVDEDVWESVNSVHELHSTMIVDTSVRDISGHSFQMSEENKENLHLSQLMICKCPTWTCSLTFASPVHPHSYMPPNSCS
ncbi:hypothetical protein D915_010524 [Fasciola hepatica]|uniref:Uncharacterized protein n=1 Tax=Fasciola hepatica TaxID=6192 RepID=A0A4E0RVR5_FASHE|nr:hypothetical protein D915_010524 [Fasciola hepatica]